MIIFKNLILKISSLRFAISLIIFIAITSGIGTFIPQGSNKKFYIENFDSAPIFGFLACDTQARRVAKTGVMQGEEASPKVVPMAKGAINFGILFSIILISGPFGN